MRTPLVILAGSLLTACASGTRVVYVPVPASSSTTRPVPAPTPAPPPPVAVTIARVDDSRLLVSTNQPAYIAVFEIVPHGGLSLVYPGSPRQRQVTLTGSHWLTVPRWSPRNTDDRYARDARDDFDSRRDRWGSSERYVYAIASERPLRLSDDAFDDDYLRYVVGSRAYRAAEPYEAIGALARRFVPAERDEDWGEDLYAMRETRTTVIVRVAKIYCPDGSITYVRDEMADRAFCPYRGRGGPATAPVSRPDSVVASNGDPILRRPDPRIGPPVFRVPKPAEEPSVEQQGKFPVGDGKKGDNGNNGNGNGNNGNGNNGNDDDRGRKGDGRDRGHDDGGNKQQPDKDPHDKDHPDNEHHNNGHHYGWDKNGKNGNDAHADGKPEQKPEEKPEPKVEQKPARDPEPNAQQKPDQKPEPTKPDAKPDDTPKVEARGMGSATVIRMRENARRTAAEEAAAKAAADSSSDRKDRKDKPD